jgi:pyruvate-formate lyase
VQVPIIEILNTTAPIGTPVRLSAETTELARRGLCGEFGRQMKYADESLKDGIPFTNNSPNMRYAHTVKLIAENAPLRILPEQQIVGAAPYLEAPYHLTPVSRDRSTSHVTLGFDHVLRVGYRGLREQIERRLAEGDLDDKGTDLLQGMLLCLDAAGMWHRRYLDQLSRRIRESSSPLEDHYRDVLKHLERVPEAPPRSFREAVQSLWFMYAFQRLCGNWPGIGRIDQMLGPFLDRDLANGVISMDEARELLAHFWISGTEWIGSREYLDIGASGDAQHYQNIILSGVDREGNEVTNDVTYLVLDVVEELHISDFPVAVRLNSNSPEKLLRRVAEVQRLGGGIVSVYQEEVVIQGLIDLGIPVDEAREFVNDGCWEVLVGGRTAFKYFPFDMLIPLQQAIGLDDACTHTPAYEDFEALYDTFLARLSAVLSHINENHDRAFLAGPPAPLLSLFVRDCISKGRGYHDRGARYTFAAPHAGGMADAANSLLAIKRVAFDERRVTFERLVCALKSNWEELPDIREVIRKEIPTYGNDDAEADAMMMRLFDDYTALVRQNTLRNGVHRPAGISTFGREIPWREHRKATAHGFRQGDTLATNLSPTPGTNTEGPTATLKSYCKMDFTKLPNGGTLDLRLHPTAVKNEDGLKALVGLLKAFVRLGGFYLNIDVVDAAVLREAQEHPERYPNLVVRIAGWCARFHTLHRDWQDMIIQRIETPGD